MLPESIICDIIEYLPLSNQIGVLSNIDTKAINKANKITVRSVRKWIKDRKAYWQSIRLWTSNRIYLTKRLTSNQCIQRYVPNKFKKKNLREVEIITLISKISHTKELA